MVRDQSTSARWEDLVHPADLWRLIWSSEGWRCIFVVIWNGHKWVPASHQPHRFFKTNEEAEAYVLEIDQAEGIQAYHACGTTQDDNSRKQENIWHLKCYWLDIDCGPDKPYGDVAEAQGELQRFCAAYELPAPLVVASGHGLHCYWVLERPVSPEEWQPGADALKLACERHGLRADHSRTTDCASILRPPGTRNKKYTPPPVVTGTGSSCAPIALADFGERVRTGTGERVVAFPSLPPRKRGAKARDPLSRDAAAIWPQVPTSAAKIAEHCAQLAHMRNTKGDVSEPLWYANLCVFVYCDDGHELAHAWSSGYPQYTIDETEAKFEHAKADSPGPTTCERFHSLEPAPCEACPHWQPLGGERQITSPIQLGRQRVAPEAADTATDDAADTAEDDAADTAEETAEETKNAPRILPTDFGNTRRLVARHGSNIRFVPHWKQWLIWTDGQWRRDKDGAIVRLAKDTVEEIFTEAESLADSKARKRQRIFALRSQAAARIHAMVELAESEAAVVITPDKLDADPWMLGVRNGVIDLRTGEFRAARRDDYVTMIAGVAHDSDAACPNWLETLDKITDKNDELIAYLQRMTGYMLTGDVSEEVFFIAHGGGNNGKSTFRETIFKILGEYAIAADGGLLLSHRQPGGATPEIARLKGRRLVCINETNENDRLNEARVKFITSTDTITARNLYAGLFDFRPTHKTIVTANHKPVVRGTDEGIWRRIHLLPFTVTIPTDEVEKNFREKHLDPELPGILNWMLKGLEAYQEIGLAPPAAVRGATEKYRKDMDVIALWLDQRCIVDPKASIASKAAYADYAQWGEDTGTWVMKQNRFTRRLGEMGFARGKETDGRRQITGLRLQASPDEDGCKTTPDDQLPL
jgi:putative DNA primase/helicase